MPTTRHFWKRQNWHRFLRRLSTGQFLSAKHTYLDPFCTVLCETTKMHYNVKRQWPKFAAKGLLFLRPKTLDVVKLSSSSPWRIPCSPHRCGPRSAGRRRCPRTRRTACSPSPASAQGRPGRPGAPPPGTSACSTALAASSVTAAPSCNNAVTKLQSSVSKRLGWTTKLFFLEQGQAEKGRKIKTLEPIPKNSFCISLTSRVMNRTENQSVLQFGVNKWIFHINKKLAFNMRNTSKLPKCRTFNCATDSCDG